MNFSFRRYWSIFETRNREFYRDLGALGWVFLFPFLMVIGFNYLFNLDDNEFYKVGMVGKGSHFASPLVQEVSFEDLSHAQNKLRYHKIDAIIDYRGEKPEIWLNQGSVKSKIVWKILLGEQFSQEANQYLIREVEGQKVRYVEWLLPGLISFNMVWMALWGVGWVVVRHRKLGILKRLKSSPVTAFEYLLAQISSRLLVLIGSGVVVFAGSYLIHPYPIRGSLVDLFFLYSLGCFCHCGLGLIVAARISSEELANGILNLLTYPMMFLSEIWFSLEGSPEWVKTLSQFMPLWHMCDGMRRILYEGATLGQMSSSLVLFGIVAALGLFLGSLTFRWQSER